MFSYRSRIRTKTFLWGGRGVTANLGSPSPIFLTIRVDDASDAVAIGQTRRDSGNLTEIPLGKLAEGESFTIALNNVCGVFAAPDNDNSTFLSCTIHGAQ